MPKKTAKKKVVLGMSGGVDSSVSLMLLKKSGFDVIGVSIKYDVYNCSRRKENVCCSDESFQVAKRICKFYGCQHRTIDLSKEFKKEVIDYFQSELKSNRTPSPCVFCNRKVKFQALFQMADKLGAQFVATGHYAKIIYDDFEGQEQHLLVKAQDDNKDQTYSLAFLDKDLLGRILFPLADLTKKRVYELANATEIFDIYKKIKQSQDFCFLNANELDDFIKKEVHPKPGKIIDEKDRTLGHHEGLSYYTIGQRKKIRLPGGPYYVIDKKQPNTLIVSSDLSLTYRKKVQIAPVNLLADLKDKRYSVLVKTRSTEQLQSAEILINRRSVTLIFKKAVSQLVPGQIATFYLKTARIRKLICLGGGVIKR